MRMDVEKIPFSAVAGGGTLTTVDCEDAGQVAVAVDVDSVTGAPTNFRAIALAFADVALGGATEHVRKTADMTAAGIAYLAQRGSTIMEPAFENVYPKIRVIADFTGGTAPTMTGSVYIFRKR